MKHPVVHFEVIGDDHDALTAFYSKVFEWSLQQMPGAPYSTTADHQPGEPGIGGGIGSDEDPARRGVLVYIAVPDTDAHLRKVEEAGGKTVVPTTTIPGVVTYAIFEDPQGNRVGVVNEDMPSA